MITHLTIRTYSTRLSQQFQSSVNLWYLPFGFIQPASLNRLDNADPAIVHLNTTCCTFITDPSSIMSEFLEFYAMNVKLLHSRQCVTVNISQRCFAQSNLCVTAFASVWQPNANLTCLIGLTQLYVRQTRLDVFVLFL